MHFENARFQMLKWDKPSITWENYDKIIISTKWLITQTNELMSHNDCYDTHRFIEIQVWFAESGQVFLRNLFSIPSPDSHFSEESWKKMEASTKKA